MAHVPASARRTPKELAIRGALTAGAAWLGYGAINQSLAYAIRVNETERAYALAPHNGRITGLLSTRFLQSAGAIDRARAEALARTALRQDASAIDAVATLGLTAQMRGDSGAARRLFAYSDMLSRRDLRTRLWMIEDAVARGDTAGALRSYDIALRTSRLAGDILFPILSSAIANAAIRDNLVRSLATKPAWSGAFISHVATLGPDAIAAASLLRALHRQRIAMSADIDAIIINRLIAQNHVPAAWTYYAAVTPGADPRRSRDSRFVGALQVPSAFDWQPIEDSGIASSIQRDGDGGMFDFAAASSVGGPMLRQTQVLPPGDYVLEGRSVGLDQPDASLPYWSLSCLSGREIGRIVVPRSAQGNGRFAGSLTVPGDCPVQHLTLVARASDNVAGMTGQIRQVELRPAQRRGTKQ